MDKVLQYFSNDSMASDSWKDKYQMKNKEGIAMEELPSDMHMRMATEFARVECNYINFEISNYNQVIDKTGKECPLSIFGETLFTKRLTQTQEQIAIEFFNYFDRFSQIIPQGSIMSNLGNPYIYGSLSNCFGIAPPKDSYGGIFRADQELVQLMKRRGGVGTHLNNLRPSQAAVSNAAKSSSGAFSFSERYSNSTREVAQQGRRGALMLLLSVKHPDIFSFITMKADRTKVTGANISVMFTDDFMFAVENDADFYCTFPTEIKFIPNDVEQYNLPYNQVEKLNHTDSSTPIYVMRVKAKELFDEFVSMAHDNAEPGAAYIDRIINYAPDGVYSAYVPEICNPCGEQWFHRDDTCRLIAANWFCVVKSPFTPHAEIDFEKVYEVFYMQQRLGDNLVDLEAEYIDRILVKLSDEYSRMDEQDQFEAQVEINLWKRIKAMALNGRRTGGGFTALADMIAALGLPYNSPDIIEQVMRKKMEAELDATIDMAILRGTFIGHNSKLEFELEALSTDSYQYGAKAGKNSFYQMLIEEFPRQANRMAQYGRRNVSWSTVAPTGTVSVMSQTTSGLEPLFKAYYIRRKKVVPGNENVRVDFVDETGDSWQEYPVLHPKFEMWIKIQQGFTLEGEYITNSEAMSNISSNKLMLQAIFEQSPWYQSEANDINWETRIAINEIIQKYTSNSLSCTINLPKDISKDVVKNIYFQAWKKGLKGITIYRDGSRDGVLISETKLTNCDEFGYTDAIKRPKELEADYHYITNKGKNYAVFIGKINNNPYEIFVFEDPIKYENVVGKIVKLDKGVYSFKSPNYTVDNLQLSSDHIDEKLLTRWVSLLLRHGANPKFIVEQVEKSEVSVVSFAKAVTRVLKTYIHDEITGELCPNCNQPTMIYEEGCKKCVSCGHGKC